MVILDYFQPNFFQQLNIFRAMYHHESLLFGNIATKAFHLNTKLAFEDAPLDAFEETLPIKLIPSQFVHSKYYQ